MAELETLYLLVSEAIRRAETLEDLRAPGVQAAHLEVSIFEEQIAKLLPSSTAEGAIARRGAVRAAIAASEFGRAKMLADRFIRTAEAGSAIVDQLAELAEEATRIEMMIGSVTAARYPKAAKRYGIENIRTYAQAYFRQLAPFPIS